MSVGEYLIIFAAILIGLSVADLALSLHRLLRAGRDIHWHPIVPIVALIALCLILNLWWGLYGSYSHQEQVSFLAFLPQVLMMLSLFLLSAAVLPDERLPKGASLKDYYLDSRIQIWGLLSCYLFLVTFNIGLGGMEEGWTMERHLSRSAGNLIGIALCAVLIKTRRMILHWVIVLLFLTTIILSWSALTIGAVAQAQP